MNNLQLTRKKVRKNYKRKRRHNQKILIFIVLSFFILAFFMLRCAIESQYPTNAICIDAGHGGDYSGAVFEKRQEKDDTLRVSLAVRDYLEEQGQKVIMTRDGDTNIGLKERTDLANKYNALCFVSIHRNSGDGKGVEIWVEHTRPQKDTQLAENILSNLKDVGVQADRGVKFGYRENNSTGDYSVNRESEMPSCLVELGFMENEIDNQMFDQHLEQYAKAIATAIMDTFDLKDKKK